MTIQNLSRYNSALTVRLINLFFSPFPQAMADLVTTHLKTSQPHSIQFPLRCPLCVNETCGKARAFFKNQFDK